MTKKLTKEELLIISGDRNHKLLSLEGYQNVHSKIKIQCLTCNLDFQTTVHSYKNARKTGCPNCKKIAISKTHTGKIVSQHTRQLIGQKASQRPGSLFGVTGQDHPRFKGGYGRSKESRSTEDLPRHLIGLSPIKCLAWIWINKVKKIYNNTCFLTGKSPIECHHLFGWNKFPEKRYLISNGVCLHKEVHRTFHNKYGYGNNTEEQFAEFCMTEFSIDWYSFKKA